MDDTSTNLKMPFILPSQAQKHVTHNEAILMLDALVHLTIADEQSTPPLFPSDGVCYVVAPDPTGVWAGKTGKVAIWQDGFWAFAEPKNGWRAWFSAASVLKVFSGSNWQDIPLPASGSFDQMGIGATPDATNRFAISSPASLFTHAGSGHQIKINKAVAGDTASLLFQTGWTGHAEMGLAGDNAFSVKVSDGVTWKTGLSISSAGHVTRPNQPMARAYRTGTSFAPTAGQQSGFSTFGVNQGGFTLGGATAGGGNSIVIPASGTFLVTLNISVLSSSGHTTTLLVNGAQTIFSIDCISGGAQKQTSTGIFSFSEGDYLTLGHAGTSQLLLGASLTEISLAML